MIEPSETTRAMPDLWSGLGRFVDRSTVPPSVKRVVHAGSRTFGRITGNARMLPDFLIAGGQRCGTTSLYRALAQHPAILKPVLHKGVHYFDTGYHRGMAWYRGHFPLRHTAARVAERVGVAPLTFESSPYYLYHPLAASRIAADLPAVKIIVLVRDPVERAYSQHAHELARGFETVTDFADALELEPARLAGTEAALRGGEQRHSHQHHGYTDRGRYVDYLSRFEDLVGRDRIHVVDSALFFTAPERVYAGVLRFLGLPEAGTIRFEQHNARRRAPLPDALRSRLDAHFRPYDERLAAWLGHVPSWRQ
ncbi:MAG: sulfotransferase domain-containing protein [Micromonosporaceae bacterium]